jgi:hypothetical protein
MNLPRPSRHEFRAAARVAVPAFALVVVAACSGVGASPTPAPSSPPNPTPVNPTPVVPSPSPVGGGTYWLRLTTSQAIPPVNLFAVGPTAVIDGDGKLIVQGAVPAIFPGPLVIPLFARQVSEAGRATIMGWAKDLGLLAGPTDFTGGGGLPGGVTGHIELTVDGSLVTLTGLTDVSAPNPEPGSPQAFGEFWRRVSSLPETLPGELGPEAQYTPSAYAILVGPPPQSQGGITGGVADWPLETPLATFGGPVANGTQRCGLVEGEDAATLRPALEQATQLTKWVQDPQSSTAYGLTVRPIVAGENPCAEVFGP